MDEAGIDMQILSHGAPSAQKLTGADAVDLTRRVNDRLQAVVAANPTRFAAFAALADQRSQGGGRRARANDQARLQGRDDPRSRQRRVSRRQAVLADLRARAGARRADLSASVGSAAGGDGRLLQGLRQGLPDGGARRVGLHGRNRDAGDPAGARRRVRRLSAAQDRPRSSRRDAAVPGVARRSRARASGREDR